ncbi:MAG: hypothetical protein M5U34_33500 [Chloroflexi bacterium]|nr:hypothetical protein [Chloroflexota bacterium]
MGLIIIMALAGFIGWFLKDATGYPYHAYGLVMVGNRRSSSPSPSACSTTPSSSCPSPAMEGWAEGLRLLVRNYIKPRPAWKKSRGGAKNKRTPCRPTCKSRPPSFQISGQRHGAQPSRPGPHQRRRLRPPGRTRLCHPLQKRSHQPDHRRAPPQSHGNHQSQHRDGIPLEMPIFLTFRVWQHEETIQPGTIPYHFDPEAIFHVNYAGSIADKENHKPWSEIIIPIATDLFITEIAGHSLDELYERDSEGQGPSPKSTSASNETWSATSGSSASKSSPPAAARSACQIA